MTQSQPFNPVVAPDAFKRLAGAPAEVLDVVKREILKLASDPHSLGRPAPCPPYVPIGHIYHFELDRDSIRHYFVVFFLFGPGADEISITDVTVTPKIR